jgi:hypothetical protein
MNNIMNDFGARWVLNGQPLRRTLECFERKQCKLQSNRDQVEEDVQMKLAAHQ